MTTLQRLQVWFQQNCNGDWEHGDAITIETLDNPGWEVRISLAGTRLAGLRLPEAKAERSEQDWTVVRTTSERFEAFGGPGNLEELLVAFLEWAQQHETH